MDGSQRRRGRRLAGVATIGVLGLVTLSLGVPCSRVRSGTRLVSRTTTGTLAVGSTFDWNGFAPTTWTGSSPYRISNKPVSGDVFLNLAWVRIPQNTTSPSAHIGLEFNQSKTACGGTSNGLVQRQAGDMLVVHDFEGGATDTATITMRRWVATGACEVSSDSAPCWGPSQNLTDLGFAEAEVNTTSSVADAIAPRSEHWAQRVRRAATQSSPAPTRCPRTTRAPPTSR